jgi:thiamine-phosphate pyrophosphorylase
MARANVTEANVDAAGARARVCGLYAVTPDERDTTVMALKVQRALRGGARLLQYRNKAASAALRKTQAAVLLPLCRAAGIPLIINDDLDLALELDADGVHLGRGDVDPDTARRRLAAGRLLGVSCYDRLDAAAAAEASGADYVALGAAFPTATKPGAAHAPLALYGQAKARLRVPIVAIGGISPANAASVMSAGADAVAVISALFDAEDVERRAREFCRILA